MGIKLGDVSPLAGAITGKGLFGKGLSKIADSGLGMLVPMSYLAQKQREKSKKRSGTATTEADTGMKKGGKVKKYAKGGSAAAAVHKHERNMHKGKPLTKLAKGGSASARADGCAKKGKTKGKFV